MTVISSPTKFLLTLSALKGVGPAALKKVAALPAFWERSIEELCKAVPQIAKFAHEHRLWHEAKDWAEEQVSSADKHGARIISPFDDEYPELLAATKDDPFLLFVKGKFAERPRQSVAIIGTREPTQHGQLIARRISQFFLEQRWSVVSGLAQGCDAIAHQTAIKAGGHTVAVLAHGLQMIAPSRHRNLAHDILDAGGALVSEYPFGTNVLGAQFVKRDRTQAGMSQGVVMIQSDVKGGSLHASRAAIDYQRWLAIPYPTDRDLENDEPKVQANLVIADGVDERRADLLRCPISSLRLVRVVRRREDYLQLITSEERRTSAVRESVPDSSEEAVAPAEEVREHASDLLQNSVALENAIPNESGPVTSSHFELTPEREPHVGELVSHQSEEQRSEQSATVPSTVVTYYLEVSPEELADLKIAQVSVSAHESDPRIRSHNYDMDIVLALSRLDHLQYRLDELRKVLTTKRHIGSQRASRSQFQVEDVLTHMKRAVDDLVRLDLEVHGHDLRSIIVRRCATNDQSQLSLLGAVVEELLYVPLIDVLGHLVNALPKSVSIYSHEKSSEYSGREFCTKVHLGDLVSSFNELVKSASFTQEAGASAKAVDG
jgi:DNA protecting protein DprA